MMLYIWLTFLPCINKSDDDDDVITIGVWDGGGDVFFLGGGGGCSPTNFLQHKFFGAAREIWAKSVFKEVSKLFYYFEEIDILYFNLKSAW